MASLTEPMLGGRRDEHGRMEEESLLGQWFTNDQSYSIVQEDHSLKYVQSFEDGTRVDGQLRLGLDSWRAASLPHGEIRLRPAGTNVLISQFRPAQWRYYFGTRVARKRVSAKASDWQGVFGRPKVVAAALSILLVTQGIVLSGVADPELSDAHFVGQMWDPVQPVHGTCLMPPPQPFYFEVGAAMSKTLLMATVTNMPSVMQWAREYPKSTWEFVKSHVAFGYLVYQICSVPVSLYLVIRHWRKSTNDLECLSAMFINAPYVFNALMSLVQCAIGAHYVRHMQTWSRGAKHRDQCWRVGRGGYVERKQRYLSILALSNAILIAPPFLLIILLYVLPGLAQPMFALQFILTVSSGGAISWLLGGFDFWQRASGMAVKGEQLNRTNMAAQRYELMSVNMISHGGLSVLMSFKPTIFDDVMAAVQDTSARVMQEMAQAEEEAKSGWTFAIFFFVPTCVSIRVAVEVLFCEVAYFRAGLSAWEATQSTWCERHLVLFAASLAESLTTTSEAAVWQLWSGLQLLLEWG